MLGNDCVREQAVEAMSPEEFYFLDVCNSTHTQRDVQMSSASLPVLCVMISYLLMCSFCQSVSVCVCVYCIVPFPLK